MRRILALIAFLAVVTVAVVVLTTRGEDGQGETERGQFGFPLRGSLARDADAIDTAVDAWRAQDDEGLRPRPDEDVAVLWIGRADEDDLAVLSSRDSVAALTRRSPDLGWRIHAQSQRPHDGLLGEMPFAVGRAIVVPLDREWRYVSAGTGRYHDVGDGLFWHDGNGQADGFVLPQPAADDLVPIFITEVGGRYVRPDHFERFTRALDGGYARAVWGAAAKAAQERDEQPVRVQRATTMVTVAWTGAIPGHRHAAVVHQEGGVRSAALAYGDDEENDGAVGLGTRRGGARRTFAAGTFTEFDDVPYLVLAAGGEVDRVHALVGTQELSRSRPFALVDARRFDSDELVVFGRTATGAVVAPLR